MVQIMIALFFAGFKFWRVEMFVVPEAQLRRSTNRKRRSRGPRQHMAVSSTDSPSSGSVSEQLYVCLTEATANVNYVLHTVQRRWGADQVLVTADGLKVDDCAGTEG